jgi:tRNA(Ile2) C34 agmatinyltransferase TiaS
VTPAVLDRPASLFAERAAGGAPAAAVEGLGGGRVTLEERLEATLRALLEAGEAECPVCRARMTRAGDGGECAGCGSHLS